jgi:hypothetical protein
MRGGLDYNGLVSPGPAITIATLGAYRDIVGFSGVSFPAVKLSRPGRVRHADGGASLVVATTLKALLRIFWRDATRAASRTRATRCRISSLSGLCAMKERPCRVEA